MGTHSITLTDYFYEIAGSTSGIVVNPPQTATWLEVSGYPSPSSSGSTGRITVTARADDGSMDTSYRSTIHFISTDFLVSLPSDYKFTAADRGTNTFYFPTVIDYYWRVHSFNSQEMACIRLLFLVFV